MAQDQSKLDALNDQVQKVQADLDRLNRTLAEDQQSESRLQQQLAKVAKAAYERPSGSVTGSPLAGKPDLSSSTAAQARIVAARQQQLLAEAQRLHDQDQQAHDQSTSTACRPRSRV
jgi:uncharacterized coiled-coil protein SlyX